MKTVLDYLRLLNDSPLPVCLKDELKKLFEQHLAKPHSKTRRTRNAISLVTQERRVVNLLAGFRELRKGGFALQTPWNVGEKHIKFLVDLWVNSKKQAPGTVENKITYWRTLAEWMRKPQLVKNIDDYIERDRTYRRHYVAQEDKSWEAANVNVAEVIARLTDKDRWVAIQVELQAAFGLRARESMMLAPLQCSRFSQLDGRTRDARKRPVRIPFS